MTLSAAALHHAILGQDLTQYLMYPLNLSPKEAQSRIITLPFSMSLFISSPVRPRSSTDTKKKNGSERGPTGKPMSSKRECI